MMLKLILINWKSAVSVMIFLVQIIGGLSSAYSAMGKCISLVCLDI
jgi:hypothetical protein